MPTLYKDPREMSVRPESGITLEQDNRVETMYHWGAMVLDLCNMPVEEYMKSGFESTGSNDYMMVWVFYDGKSISQRYKKGDTITPPSVPEREGYTFIGWNKEIPTEITESLTFEAQYQINQYELSFKDSGGEVLQSSMVDYGSEIVYPEIEDYEDEDGTDYTFIWDDLSYSGETMPAKDVVIFGHFEIKPSDMIYYGSFVVPVSAYNPDNIMQYLNLDDVKNPEIYQSISAGECTGNGATVTCKIPPYEPFVDMNVITYQLNRKKYYAPLAFLYPVGIVENFDIRVTDSVGTDWWPDYVTSDEVIDIKGTKYHFYVQQTDGLRPGKNVQELDYIISINEK